MGFTENQKEVIEHGKGTLLVKAGPGSGKTTAIIARIMHLINNGVDPESFLVITFTNKAADNLKYKLRKELPNETVMKMQISTIHSFCLEYLKSKDMQITLIDDDASERKTLFLKKYKEALGFSRYSTLLDYQIPSVIDKFDEYTSFKVNHAKLYETISKSRVVTEEYKTFVDSMDFFHKKLLDDHDKPLKNKIKRDPENYDETILYNKSWYNARFLQIIAAHKKYLNLLDEYHYVDYNTLQLKTLEKLKENPKTEYKTIFVDEFQDTDPLQFAIFQILRENCDYFTAVGDVDQHIYAFRSSFNDFFDEIIAIDNIEPVPLDINFRSTENIVNLTEEFIRPQRENKLAKEIHMKNDREDCNNPNFLMKNQNSVEEAEKIYHIIKNLMDNKLINNYSDVAILYRKHSDNTIANLVSMFNENKIPFSIKGQSNLSNEPEVKSLLNLMWYITRNTNIGHIPSKDELKEQNLKAFCGDYFENTFYSLDESTKEYLRMLQDSYYTDITDNENALRDKNFKVDKIHNLKNREDYEMLLEIFKDIHMPIIDLEKIENLKDREFFEKLEKIRELTSKDESPSVLEIFYLLIGLSNIYDYELNYKEIANLALLTQSISNYETFISENDFKGAFYFIANSIENYDSYQNEGKGVQMMTIHSAKGKEFPVTIISSLEKDSFPMINKDPEREKDYVFPKDTFYTPNDCLEYKNITIAEENKLNDEEEDRVLYVAMTRAQDLLILSTIGEVPEQVTRIKDHLKDFNFDELANVELGSIEPQNKNEVKDELESLEEPVVLNYSKYTKYISCPFKYDLSYNLGFARTGGKAANRGSVFHEIMETANKKLMDGEILKKEDLEEITCETYKSMFDIEENKEEYETFKNNAINYYFKYSLNREVLDAEFDFELYVDEKILEDSKTDFILNGAIDLIYKDSNDETMILDYKYAEFDPEHIDGYIKQSYIYAMALREIPEYRDLNINKAVIHFVLSDYQYVVEIKEDKMNEEMSRLNKVAYEIHNGGEGFAKEPEKEEECSRCSYRYFCKPKEFAEQLYEKLD